MALLAVRVPKINGEKARILLSDLKLIDFSRKIIANSKYIEIPILKQPDIEQLNLLKQRSNETAIVSQTSPIFEKLKASKGTIREFLKRKLSAEELSVLPSSWEILGHVLIFRLNPKLESKKNIIGEAFLKIYYPRVRTVAKHVMITGTIREQKIEVLAGDSNTETIHRELGCKFKIDPAKLMFSFGNHYERKRMAFISNPNETVIDMFAGVGQFCIPMAVHSKPEQVFGIEINPATFHYLSENIKLNRLEYVMTPILGDCREVELAKADRIIMGYLRNTEQFLPKAFELVKPSGIIHYHEVSPAKFLFEQPINHIESITTATGKKIKILEKRIIKEYSPRTYHVVVDFQVRE